VLTAQRRLSVPTLGTRFRRGGGDSGNRRYYCAAAAAAAAAMNWSQFDTDEYIEHTFESQYASKPTDIDDAIECAIDSFIDEVTDYTVHALAGHTRTELSTGDHALLASHLAEHGFAVWLPHGEYRDTIKRILLQTAALVVIILAHWERYTAERIGYIQSYIDHSESSTPVDFFSNWYSSMLQLSTWTNHQPREMVHLGKQYAEWRSTQLRSRSFMDRVECASLFAREHGAVRVANAIGNTHAFELDCFGDDMRPFRALSEGACNPTPYSFGEEDALVQRTLLDCAGVIERLVPELLQPEYDLVSSSVADELRACEQRDRAHVTSVAMEYMHHACRIPMPVVDIVVGYMRRWSGAAPVMTLTHAQQQENDAFVLANSHEPTR
jgi:hypothetical protein